MFHKKIPFPPFIGLLFTTYCSCHVAQADDASTTPAAEACAAIESVTAVRQQLQGNWSAVSKAPCWHAIDIDPEAVTWDHAAVDPKRGPIVASEVRYRDVDEDGLADAFLCLYDGDKAYWFFAHATAPNRWKSPIHLASANYIHFMRRHPEDATPRPPDDWVWPASCHKSGRTLIACAIDHGESMSVKSSDIAYELTDAGLVEILRSTGRGMGWSLRRWNVLCTEIPGELLMYTGMCGPHGGNHHWVAHLFAPGARTAVPIECPDEDRRNMLYRNQPEPAPLPESLHELHPQRIARTLSGSPRDVAAHPFWGQIDIDPLQLELNLDPEPLPLFDTEPESDEELNRIWRIDSYTAYEDIDQDGLPDAWILMHQGFDHVWFALLQTKPGVWSCPGLIGMLAIEHGGGDYANKPILPQIIHLNGRSFIIARTGVAMDMYYDIKQKTFLLEHGQLHLLWEEHVSSSEHMPQEAELSANPNGDVELKVVTWSGAMELQDPDATIKRMRLWTLKPGQRTLELIEDTNPDLKQNADEAPGICGV